MLSITVFHHIVADGSPQFNIIYYTGMFKFYLSFVMWIILFLLVNFISSSVTAAVFLDSISDGLLAGFER